MKKIIPILLTLILAISCDNTPKFHVEGTVEGATDSILYLEAQTLEGIQPLDSVKLTASGSFAFAQQKKVENPEFYTLRISNRRINFSVDSTETITFNIKNTPNALTYDVQGSYNSQKIKEISEQQTRLQQQIIAIERNENLLPGDIVDSINGLVSAYKEKMKNEYIFKEPLMAYSYYAVCQSITDLAGTYQLFNPLTDRADVKCYATIATAWDGQWHDAERTIQICNTAIRGMGNTATPKTKELQVDESKIVETSIIDIELPDINSKFHKLTSLKGKVVLLDFTIYGAQESPKRTRLMRELYNKYHAQGLEIYQISLDDDLHYWKEAVESLPWICVHETDGTATKTYAVFDLPTFFLINRANEIVKRNDVIKDVEAEIKALL
ncbi:MAG: AhpC/TSA family protein [Bacteroidaceae bacterium]|nr:AhpC/TSA family protein [Bacteroidaceae bacterium]